MLILYYRQVFNFKYTEIKGGKYTRYDKNIQTYRYLRHIDLKAAHTQLPFLCLCQLPCDVRIDENNNISFHCPKLNMWEELRDHYCSPNHSTPCTYQAVYDNDMNYLEKTRERQQSLKKLCVHSRNWLNNLPCQCFGRPCRFCKKSFPEISLLYWNGETREVCSDCFLDSYNVVHEHYYYDCISPMFLSSDDEN